MKLSCSPKDGLKKNALSARQLSDADLVAEVMKKTKCPVPDATRRYSFANAKATLYFRNIQDAKDCDRALNGQTINGRLIKCRWSMSPEFEIDNYPDSNWITIQNIDESVTAIALKVHFKKKGLNPKNYIRILDIGGNDPNVFRPIVDMEFVSHEIALQCMRKLRMTELNGKKLWAFQRPAADFEDGTFMPAWARKQNLSKEEYLEQRHNPLKRYMHKKKIAENKRKVTGEQVSTLKKNMTVDQDKVKTETKIQKKLKPASRISNYFQKRMQETRKKRVSNMEF